MRGASAAPTVVALEPVARDPQRVRIMVKAADRSRARCVHILRRDQANAMRIRAGSRWSAATDARASRIVAMDSVRDDALKAIARSRHGLASKVLAARLLRAGHPSSLVDDVIAQLRTDGWISDRIPSP